MMKRFVSKKEIPAAQGKTPNPNDPIDLSAFLARFTAFLDALPAVRGPFEYINI